MFAFVKRALSCLFVSVVLLSACAPKAPVIRNQPNPVTLRIKKTFHADTSFSPQEREDITKAIDILNRQANGFILVDVVFDLNWDSGAIEDLEDMEKNADQIVKMPHDSQLVLKMDVRNDPGVHTLGYCKVTWGQPWIPVKVYIIYDRLTNRKAFVHVVLHEILHAVQVHHVNDADAIMFHSTNQNDPVMCMNMSDMTELCRVWHCDPTTLNFCD